jgi:hypothetical protein
VDSAPHHHCSPGNPEDELVTACNQEAFNQCKGDTCAGIRVLLVTGFDGEDDESLTEGSQRVRPGYGPRNCALRRFWGNLVDEKLKLCY